MAQPEAQKNPHKLPGITRLTVQGYKSIAEKQDIDIKPLTILAGANSSGKSSIMQPLLLLKQTLEAPYDPGAVRLDGDHVEFTRVEEMLARQPGGQTAALLHVGVRLSHGREFRTALGRGPNGGLAVVESTTSERDYAGRSMLEAFRAGMTHEEVAKAVIPEREELRNRHPDGPDAYEWTVQPNRFLLEPVMVRTGTSRERPAPGDSIPPDRYAPFVRHSVLSTIHVPGLRDLPGRAYPRTGTGPMFEGTFDPYTASIIEDWQDRAPGRVEALAGDLRSLDLTSSIRAQRRDDVSLEVYVGRLPVGSPREDDEVNIADVGLGVSQSLPALVALRAADEGRLVYIEQPELHLHPRAQVALAGVLADAALRGVRVVAETHSALLLLAVQTLIASKDHPLTQDGVALHWFRRGDDGVTDVATADELDGAGRFGDWPQDFGDVELLAENEYLDAAYAALEE